MQNTLLENSQEHSFPRDDRSPRLPDFRLRGDQPGSDRQGESVVVGVTRYLVADRGADLASANW